MTKKLYAHGYYTLGILGALIILYGHTQNHPQIYYIFGSIALLATAIYYKLFYFMAFELILASGHTAILLGVGPYTQFALPVLLTLQLLIFYSMLGRTSDLFLLFGIIGIAFLSLGFAYNNQWVFFSGSSFVSVYAYYLGIEGKYPAYIWAILNTIFALIAFYKLIILYF